MNSPNQGLPKRSLLAWLDKRIDLSTERRWAESALAPAGLKGWFFTLGALALFIFGLQFLTGLLLALNYSPSPDHALDSVRYVTNEVTILGFRIGALVRSVHHWGASLMVIVVFLHIIRVLLYRSYRAPRELSWLSGVILFALVLGFAFTGYLLPWDERGYWGTVVGLNIMKQVPLAGPVLVHILGGSGEIGSVALVRFYVLHVIFLPLLTVLLLSLHLNLVKRHGISEAKKGANVPYLPFHLAKEISAMAVVFAILIVLFALFPIQVGEPLKGSAIDFRPRPEWYFLSLYELLRFLRPAYQWIGYLLVPGLFTLLLVAIPFLDRDEAPFKFGKTLVSTGATLWVLFVVLLTGVGLVEKEITERPKPILAQAPVESGKTVFKRLKCIACHTFDGEGSDVGPDLTDVGGRLKVGEIRQQILNPQARNPNTVMHPFRPNPEELAALVNYLTREPDPGKKLFESLGCTGCHKYYGGAATIGPDLTDIKSRQGRDYIVQKVRDPESLNSGSIMPSFKQLSARELDDLAEYLLGGEPETSSAEKEGLHP